MGALWGFTNYYFSSVLRVVLLSALLSFFMSSSVFAASYYIIQIDNGYRGSSIDAAFAVFWDSIKPEGGHTEPSCSKQSDELYFCFADAFLEDGRSMWYGPMRFPVYVRDCGSKTDGYCAPSTPQNCKDLANDDPDFHTYSYSGESAQLTMCNQGCSMVLGGGVSTTGGGLVTANYRYDSTPCPSGSGYDPSVGLEQSPNNTEDPKKCYDLDGKYLGQISNNSTCPNLVKCYDIQTGDYKELADSPAECSTGTASYTALSQAAKNIVDNKRVSTNVEVDAEGNVTQTTDVSTSETGVDGTSTGATDTTKSVTDKNGNTTTTKTSSEQVEACAGDDCPQKPVVKNASTCGEKVVYECKGDIFECAKLELARAQYCEALANKDLSGLSSEIQKAIAEGKLGDPTLDGYGQLDALNGGEVDVTKDFNFTGIFRDAGDAGSCPAPVDVHLSLFGDLSFDYQPICDYASLIRFLVLFAATWVCSRIAANAILETRW